MKMEYLIDNSNNINKHFLEDFTFSSNFIKIQNQNIHYIDEGPPKASPILLLHGVPTWSYLFRKVIPVLVKKGHRVIVPDLPGFGRSDKPKQKEFYTYDVLCNHLSLFIKKLKLQNIVLLGHDWGTILGLRLAVENNERFAGLIMSNGLIPRGDEKVPLLFHLWKIFTKYSPILPVGKLINIATQRNLSKSEKDAYDLPFKQSKNKIALRVLPQLLPFKPNSPDFITAKMIWNELEKWEKPFLTLFSDKDKITKGGDKILQKYIPGTVNQQHIILKGKHFIPEDAGEEIGLIIDQFINTL